jgi:hypothetical protein
MQICGERIYMNGNATIKYYNIILLTPYITRKTRCSAQHLKMIISSRINSKMGNPLRKTRCWIFLHGALFILIPLFP